MPIRILIADDHAVFRSGLRALLEREPDLEVVGETGDGPQTIEQAARLEFDVLILDLSMPGLSGREVAEAVLSACPDTAIVVLTMHEEAFYLRELLRAGARGFVLKKSTGTDLIQAIRAAHHGGRYIDPMVAGKVVDSFVGLGLNRDLLGPTEKLTPREQEVCQMLAYGHTNAEIARMFAISVRTVESHRNNIMGKLHATSRADLVRYALRHGLLQPE